MKLASNVKYEDFEMLFKEIEQDRWMRKIRRAVKRMSLGIETDIKPTIAIVGHGFNHKLRNSVIAMTTVLNCLPGIEVIESNFIPEDEEILMDENKLNSTVLKKLSVNDFPVLNNPINYPENTGHKNSKWFDKFNRM